MSAFASQLVLRAWTAAEVKHHRRGKQQYELKETLTYHSKIGGTIMVPAAFVTDFASIPRPVWSLISPEDPTILYPSVVHDYLYAQCGFISGWQIFTREQSDDILREAMEVCGAAGWQRHVVHRAVRLFGGSHWQPD